jgi:hypothetical protein
MNLSFLHQKKEVGIQVMYNMLTASHSNCFLLIANGINYF